jgi:hypothetical protein
MADRPARRRRRPRSAAASPADPFTNLNKSSPGLTAKQARFVEEFCVDFNATQAAIRAGYAAGSAPAAASRLRAHPAVAAAIDVARAALRTRCDASADRWLLEVLAISLVLCFTITVTYFSGQAARPNSFALSLANRSARSVRVNVQ